jgi:peptidoglycan/LPS O-acetylase OafA/YrhL
MLLARAVQLGVRIPAPAFVWGFGALGLGGVICGLTAYTRSVGIGVQRPYVALWVLPCFALMLAAGASRDVRTGRWWLGSRPMLRLGEWSFALYLVHKPVFLLTNPWGWWGMPRGLKSLEAFIVYISLAVAVAAALHYLIEKPIEHALRRLPVGRRRRVEAPAAASGPAAAPGPAAASAAAARRVTAPRVPDEKPDERGNGAGGRPMVTQSDTTSDLRFPR